MHPLKQLVLILLLTGLIGAVVVLRRPSTNEPQAPLGDQEALSRYGFYLREVSKQCGIDFTHEAPTLDPKLDHIMPIIASMGASVTVVDFDRDGWPDLYVVTSKEGGKNHLYRNQHDGTFKDVAEAMGIADLNRPGTGVCMGAVWGDYDNDGYDDLLVYKWGRPELYHNDHGKGFTRVTEKAGLPKWVNANSAVWVDFDRDGRLDLLICGYWRDDLDLWHIDTTKIMPDDFEYATNGGRKYLLRNRGDGTFEDVTEKMGIDSHRWTLAVAAADLCGSGYPDLFLANDYGVSELYANQGGKGFVEIGKKAGIAKAPKSGMNVSFGDIYNQGNFAVYVSNISEPGNLIQGNNLWVKEEGTAGEDVRFMNQANLLGTELGGWSWGAQFGDLNNDGLLDLYLTNGYISTEDPESYWYDYSKIGPGSRLIIAEATNWPAMRGRQLSGHQQKCVWINKGGKFIDVAQGVGVTDTFDGRSIVLVDLWNRGVLDVVVANQKGPLLVYKNTVAPENQWIQFELEGTVSNRSAIGAQVRLYWNGQQQVQEVSGGNGYASQNQRRLHFGLGKEPRIEKAVIRWPSGRERTLVAPKARMLHKIKEPS
ncbi:MAG TPA: CRTAC1 family protein [Gemmataceae bacterium]|nr:CRTAC1 family protein [Gemmataceae bacterium]